MSEPFGPDETGFLARELDWEGRSLPYVVYRPPGFAERERWPAILFLHGMEESGTDGMRQVTVGLPPQVREIPEAWPFVLILPQKPDRESEWEHSTPAWLAMLERATEHDRVDDARVHLSGLSQGGHGALAIGAAHPRAFRTLSALCPYVTPPRGGWLAPPSIDRWPADELAADCNALAEALAGTPTWLFHGTHDPLVPAEQSLALHRALHERNPDSKLTLYPGVGHECWNAAYRFEGLADWMLSASDPPAR